MSSDFLWQRLCEYLGLSEYEAKTYISLIREGPSTARRLSMISNVPRTKIYGTLKKLIERGLVVEIPENPKRFLSVSPSNALGSFLKTYESKVEDLHRLVSSLERIYSRIESRIRMRRGETWTLIGRREVLDRVSNMLSRAESTVDVMTTENGLILFYRVYNKTIDNLVKKGVKIRISTPVGSRNRSIARELRYVCKIVEREVPPSIFFINVDDTEFLLASLSPDNFALNSDEDIAMMIRNPILCLLMSRIFRMRKPSILASGLRGIRSLS